MNHPTTEHPTDLPCPDWCEEPHGHPLIEDWPGAGLSRFHTRSLAASPFTVTLERYETALTVYGPTEQDLSPASVDGGAEQPGLGIRLDPDAALGEPLTGPQALALAAALIAAAEAWDHAASIPSTSTR